jgi:tryptophan synthase alpha chain
MSRIQSRFAELKKKRQVALIPFMTAGDPHPDLTVDLMHALVDAGADLIELGVPFSDPMADGPVIQAACERALVHRVGMRDVLGMVRAFRQTDNATPVVLMGYLNPIEVMGYPVFAREAAAAGVDGALTVDLPPEESADLTVQMEQHGMDPIFLLAPTSPIERIKVICKAARGFVYYVSLKGVTGAANLDVAAVSAKLNAIREWTSLPIGVGFGIHDASSAARIARVADAVVVGSAVVRKFAEFAQEPTRIKPAITALLREMRQAMDAETLR